MSAADLAREFAALNDAIRKSHELLADMRAERKLMGQLLLDVRAEIKGGVAGLINAEVEKQINVLGVETEEAIRRTVKKVNTIFDNYISVCLGTDPQSVKEGRAPVPELVQEAYGLGIRGPAVVDEYLRRVHDRVGE